MENYGTFLAFKIFEFLKARAGQGFTARELSLELDPDDRRLRQRVRRSLSIMASNQALKVEQRQVKGHKQLLENVYSYPKFS